MPSFVVKAASTLIVASIAWASSSAQAEEPSGTILANTCFSCHGPDGHSAGAMPSIAGKSADYIVDTLKRFREGNKASTVMGRITKGFTDEEIEALASYFSSN